MKKALIIVLLALAAFSAACGRAEPTAQPVEVARANPDVAVQPVALTEVASVRTGQPPAEIPAVQATSERAIDASAVVASPETSPTPTPAASNSEDPAVRTARTLFPVTVYADAAAGSPALGELEGGSLVVVTAVEGGRYQIIYVDSESRYGWVSRDALTFDVWGDSAAAETAPTSLPAAAEPTAAAATETSSPTATIDTAAFGDADLTGGTVLAGPLNVRSGPGTVNASLGQLSQGQRVEIVDRQEGWLEIVYPAGAGGLGWVSADYVAVDGEAAPALAAAPPTPAATAGSAASGLVGTLVFQQSNGGTIYVYDLASQSLRELTGGFDPALSPDGSTVAFTRYGGQQGLYLIDIDGSNERLIYSGSESLRGPKWSPDGRYLVFSRVTGYSSCRQVGPRCVPDGPGLEGYPLITAELRGLSRVDGDGGNFRDIPALETATAPDWTEAGIVYASEAGIQATADQPDAANWLVAGDFAYRYLDPDQQPGGGRIVFQSKEGSHWELKAVNPDGSGETVLTRPATTMVEELPQNVSPAWSPDGRSIVYLSNRGDDNSAGPWRLWVMDADGGNQRLLDPDALGQIAFRYDFNNEQMVDWR